MDTKAQLVKACTKIAEDTFDKQMLDLIEIIKSRKKLHAQHRTTMLEYIGLANKVVT